MKANKSKTQTKEYSPFLEPFLIKFFKLKPNRYTENDFLFIYRGSDFNVLYNPRCQLLDITPVSKDWWEKYHSFQAERITRQVKKLWEELSFAFLLEHGRNIDELMVARLYALQSDSHPYITYLTKNQNEWTEVENWPALIPQYQKRKLFAYAYYGETVEKQPKVPANLKKQLEKAQNNFKKEKQRKVIPEHIIRFVAEQDN